MKIKKIVTVKKRKSLPDNYLEEEIKPNQEERKRSRK